MTTIPFEILRVIRNLKCSLITTSTLNTTRQHLNQLANGVVKLWVFVNVNSHYIAVTYCRIFPPFRLLNPQLYELGGLRLACVSFHNSKPLLFVNSSIYSFANSTNPSAGSRRTSGNSTFLQMKSNNF